MQRRFMGLFAPIVRSGTMKVKNRHIQIAMLAQGSRTLISLPIMTSRRVSIMWKASNTVSKQLQVLPGQISAPQVWISENQRRDGEHGSSSIAWVLWVYFFFCVP